MKNKLKFLVLGIIILTTRITVGQQVNYEVIYNSSTCLYEAHAHVVGGTLAFPNTIPFPSKFSVVVPASISDLPFTVIQNYNPQGLSWSNSNNIYAPAASPGEDFHAFTVSGGGSGNAYPLFTTGTNILLFTFSVPHIGCNQGIRCFNNDTDPNSGAAGMSGIDFTQSFKTMPNIDRYLGNIGGPVLLPLPLVSTSHSFLCNNINDLYLTSSANNNLGCGSLTFNWTGTGGFSSNLQNPVVNPYSTPGVYTVTATDANGCTNSSSVNIAQPAVLLAASINIQTNVNCFGNSTGSATVTAIGGNPPYNFSWNTTPVQSDETAIGLVAGNYTVTVTDFNGCTTTADVTISQPGQALSATGITLNSTCNLTNNGSINLTTIGGTPNYSYLWSNNAITKDISNLAQGSYSVSITDNKNCTYSINFNVSANNCQPIAVNDVKSTNEDTPVSGAVDGNDTPSGDGGNLWTLTGVNGGAVHGTVSMLPDGSYTYTPDVNYNGNDVFTYKVCDTDNDCSTAIVTITINPVNDMPLAVNDIISTDEDTPVNGTVYTNDTPSGDGGNTWSLDGANGGATHGIVTMDNSGNYNYTPNSNYNGTDVFSYKVCDADNDCATATVTVTINPVNDPPIAINDVNSGPENTSVNGNVLTNDSDPDGNTLSVIGINFNGTTYLQGVLTNIPGSGSIIINSDGTYTFTPLPNWSGNVPVISYIISDGFGGNATANLSIHITPVPHNVDLSVTKLLTDPNPLINDTIYKNDIVTFTIVLKNNSTIFNATNITLIDTLPAGLSYISSIPSIGNYNHITGIWTLPNLNALATATLSLKAKVDTSAENNVYIIACDQPDPNNLNNHSFASVSISSSSSGNDGGLESNGNLASKVGLRNFMRHKIRDDKYNDPGRLELFSQATVVSAKTKSTQPTEMINFIPLTGPTGAPAMVTTPMDLVGISNAIEVVSVDYFDAVKRKAAILAIASNAGTVYEHTKMVCDRLDGGSLKSINYVTIKGHTFIIAGIVQENGSTDYAVSFIAYKSGNTYAIDNQWDLEQYSPSGNQPVLNFQVWSINEQQTIELVGKIIDQMTTAGYGINYKNTTYPKFPEVYVQNGIYKDGNLELNVINTNASNAIQINGTKALVEDGVRYPFNYATPVSTAYNSNISIPSGNIFDIGFSMGNNASSAKDVLYFADGPWGREFDQAGASISDFSISTQLNNPMTGAFNLGRNANLEGSVKTYASLYRVLRVGNKPINLTNYNKLEFTAFGSGSFDVIISKASIVNWNEQYRTTVNLDNNNAITYQIPVSQFVNAQGQHNLNLNDAVTVVFVKKGNNSTYQNFTLNVKDMRFTNSSNGIDAQNAKVSSFSVSPNPFYTTTNITFNLPKDQKVKIELYSLEGKLLKSVENKMYYRGLNSETINAEGLKAGVYMIKLETETNSLYEKVVLVK